MARQYWITERLESIQGQMVEADASRYSAAEQLLNSQTVVGEKPDRNTSFDFVFDVYSSLCYNDSQQFRSYYLVDSVQFV
jgi:hypothetical protein